MRLTCAAMQCSSFSPANWSRLQPQPQRGSSFRATTTTTTTSGPYNLKTPDSGSFFLSWLSRLALIRIKTHVYPEMRGFHAQGGRVAKWSVQTHDFCENSAFGGDHEKSRRTSLSCKPAGQFSWMRHKLKLALAMLGAARDLSWNKPLKFKQNIIFC